MDDHNAAVGGRVVKRAESLDFGRVIVDLNLITDVEGSGWIECGIDVLVRVGVIGPRSPDTEVGDARVVLRRERLDVEDVAEVLAFGGDLQPGQIKNGGRASAERDLKIDLADLKAANFAGVDVLKRGLCDGRSWARTSDLQLVELALSRLSYAPGKRESSARPASPSEQFAGSSEACVGVRVQPAGRPLYGWENPRTDE